MKRIIKISTIIPLSILFCLLISCSNGSKPLLSEVGIVSFSFRNQFQKDVPGTLDIIKSMGITNIEFSNLFGKTAFELRAYLDEREMICTSYGVSYGRIVEDIEKVAEEAKILGAKYVRVANIPYEKPEFKIEDAKKAVEVFNTAGKTLHEIGIYFCYHNHGFEFRPYEDGTLYDYIVTNTDPRFVSFEIDLLWTVHPGQCPVTLLKKYPDRYRLMHLKDLKKGIEGDLSGGTDKENDVILGTGQVDFPAVLKAAQKTNIEYYYIEDESPDVIERVPISLAYIKSLTK